MERDFKDAVSTLDSYRRRRGTVKGNPPPGKKGGTPGLYRVAENLRLLGYQDADLDRLNAIHVAGTKGKGTTCMSTNCFLQAHGERTGFPRKIGLYTAPHLISVRECFRINSKPISEASFTKYAFEVFDALSNDADQNPGTYRPGHSHVLTILAFHVFFSESVDVAIFETNCGGTNDATNIVRPKVVGITKIGIDHISTLGSTIESIASHKSGIFKFQIPAFSSLQVPAATIVLEQRAAEKFTQLTFVNMNDKIPPDTFGPSVQRENASLALALASCFLLEVAPEEGHEIIPEDISRGRELYAWPGRFQQITKDDCQWFLDSAHNEISLSVVGKWFADVTAEMNRNIPQILIFSHASERDGQALVKKIAMSLKENCGQMQHVIFCTMEESRDFHYNYWYEVSEEMLHSYAATWSTVDSTAHISLKPNIKEALKFAKMVGDRENGMRTLVTGHNYLVGVALYLLELSGDSMYDGSLIL